MGLRGPQPKPTALKEAQGNPGRRRLNDGEPVPPAGPVTPPRFLRGIALEIWTDLAPLCVQMRTLTSVDRYAFARYCSAYARYLELREFCWDKGPMGTLYPLKDKKGKTRNAGEWPQAAELRRLHELLIRLEDRFGLTPASRTRLRVTDRSDHPTTGGEPSKAYLRLVDFTKGAGPKAPRPIPPSPDIPF